MGFVKLKFNSEYLGPLLLDTDPIGLDDIELEIKRSKENSGVMYILTLNLEFVKEGRRYLKTVYDDVGVEAKVFVTLFSYNANSYTWDEFFNGTIKFDNYDEEETTITSNIEQIGFERTFLSLVDTDIDLETLQSHDGKDIPATPTVDQVYHSKKILKLAEVRPQQDVSFTNVPGALDFQIGKCVVGPCYNQQGAVIYGQIETSDAILDDVEQVFNLPFGFSPTPLNPSNITQHFHNVNYNVGDVVTFGPDIFTAIAPSIGKFPPDPAFWAKGLIEVARYNKNPRNAFYEADEAGVVDFAISVRLQHTIAVNQFGGSGDVDINWPCSSSGRMGYREIRCYFEHRDAGDNILTLQEFGSWNSIKGCGGGDVVQSGMETKFLSLNGVNVNIGDTFYCYYLVAVYAEYKKHGGTAIDITMSHDFSVKAEKASTFIKITNASTGIPDSNCKSILVHEGMKKLAQFATGKENSFESSILGRTDSDPNYPQDGELSLRMLTNGANLRNSANTIIFSNWSNLFESLNATRPLGWGFELRDGELKIIVEGIEYFFDVTKTTLQLAFIPDNIKRTVARDEYYNIVTVGYPKLDVKQSNGVDEYNTIRKFSVPYTLGKGTRSFTSIYRTAGFEIESQRRLIGKTEDSKLDPENFLTCVVRSASPSGYDTERNQNFPQITNIFDPDSVYNIRVTPRRNLEKWVRVLASATYKLQSRLVSFSSGEFNYTAGTREASETFLLNEDDNLDTGKVNPIWIPEVYTFVAPFSNNDWKFVIQNPYGVVKFTDRDGVEILGFVLSIKFKIVKNEANFQLLRAFKV